MKIKALLASLIILESYRCDLNYDLYKHEILKDLAKELGLEISNYESLQNVIKDYLNKHPIKEAA